MPILLDTEGKVALQYNVHAIPATFIIGKDGTVKKIQVGSKPEEEPAVRKLIADELKK